MAMTALAIVTRRGPAPSSPPQVRAAERLRGSDGVARPSANGLPFHQCRINRTPENKETLQFRAGS